MSPRSRRTTLIAALSLGALSLTGLSVVGVSAGAHTTHANSWSSYTAANSWSVAPVGRDTPVRRA